MLDAVIAQAPIPRRSSRRAHEGHRSGLCSANLRSLGNLLERVRDFDGGIVQSPVIFGGLELSVRHLGLKSLTRHRTNLMELKFVVINIAKNSGSRLNSYTSLLRYRYIKPAVSRLPKRVMVKPRPAKLGWIELILLHVAFTANSDLLLIYADILDESIHDCRLPLEARCS